MALHIGRMLEAGTNQSSALIKIFGLGVETKEEESGAGQNGWSQISGALERGSSKLFAIDIEARGPLQYAQIRTNLVATREFQGTPWYLEKITVRHESETASPQLTMFPHYQWISANRSEVVYTAQTLLPQDDSKGRVSARKREIRRNKDIFVWSQNLPLDITAGTTLDTSNILPRFFPTADLSYKSLDFTFKFLKERLQEEQRKGMHTTQIFKRVLADIGEFKSMEDYMKFSDLVTDGDDTPEDAWLEDWNLDSEFGRQTLNGNHPSSIERVRKIPKKIPLRAHHVEGFLRRGLSLDEEAAAGNIYMVDHKILEGIPTRFIGQKKGKGKKLEVATPIAIFYHSPKKDQLVPIAIQLCQTPGPECPIWTPRDTKEDWVMAKIWFRNADVQVSTVVSHLAHVHFVVEPFAIAMRRCLPPAHPVHKLMKEHLKYIVAVNTKGREVMTSAEGSIQKINFIGSKGALLLTAKAFREFHFDDLDYPENLKKRDVLDLPGFHHRDDALLLWDAILDYVTDMMNLFYERDADVVADWELQGWVKDVSENGFGMIEDVQFPSLGVPQRLETKQELVMLLQKLIFTTSVRHHFAAYYAFQ